MEILFNFEEQALLHHIHAYVFIIQLECLRRFEVGYLWILVEWIDDNDVDPHLVVHAILLPRFHLQNLSLTIFIDFRIISQWLLLEFFFLSIILELSNRPGEVHKSRTCIDVYELLFETKLFEIIEIDKVYESFTFLIVIVKLINESLRIALVQIYVEG